MSARVQPKRPIQNFHASSLSRRWVAAINASQGHIFAFSPFITNCRTTEVLAKKGMLCHLYTVVSFENYSSGGSKVSCLRKLYDAGVKIFHVENLHAKILLIRENNFVTTGSQNMTDGGTRNKEASVVFGADKVASERAWKATKPWRDSGKEVGEAEVKAIEEHVKKLEKQHRIWKKDALKLSRDLWVKWQNAKDEQARRAAEAERKRIAEASSKHWRGWQQRFASEVIRGKVVDQGINKWSLMNQGQNFGRNVSYRKWMVGGKEVTLHRSYWYPCFNLDTRHWGKARVFESCISFIDCYLGWNYALSTGGINYRIAINCRRVQHEETPHNISIEVTFNDRAATILGHYNITTVIADAFLDEAKWKARNTPEDAIAPFRQFFHAMNENKDNVQDKILGIITRQWSGNRLLRGDRADKFFQPWQRIYTGLRLVPGDLEVLVFSQSRKKVLEGSMPIAPPSQTEQ